MAEFEHQYATGLEVLCGLSDETRIEFVAFFAAVQRDFGFMLANFTH